MSWLLLILLPMLFSCSKAPQDTASSCLQENLSYLNQKPHDLKEFVLNIGKTSKFCDASDEDIKTYVGKIIEKYGKTL